MRCRGPAAIHVLVKGGGLPEIADWVCQELPREKPEQDLHGIMREALKTAGITDQEIAARDRNEVHAASIKQGTRIRPDASCSGSAISELEAAVSHDRSMGSRCRIRVTSVSGASSISCSSAAPERLDVIAPAILEPEAASIGGSATAYAPERRSAIRGPGSSRPGGRSPNHGLDSGIVEATGRLTTQLATGPRHWRSAANRSRKLQVPANFDGDDSVSSG